jgi:PAS domain S-box-containing protein
MSRAFEHSIILSGGYLTAAAQVSLLSVWVLVGLFAYLNHYTKRRYFGIWTAAWVLYALWLTIGLSEEWLPRHWFVGVLGRWCLSATAVCLLWGSACFLGRRARPRLFGLFSAFLFVWSVAGAMLLADPFAVSFPLFSLIGLASVMTGSCFARFRARNRFIGAGLLSAGFFMWGAYLIWYPFAQAAGWMAEAVVFGSAILQLFIAVSMIILVLEEARALDRDTRKQLGEAQDETRNLEHLVASSEQRYRNVFDQADEGIVVAELGTMAILDANPAAERMLGAVRTVLKGQKLHDFCQFALPPEAPRDGVDWFEFMSRQRQVDLIGREGHCVSTEAIGSRITFGSKAACQFFFRELTDKARLEKQLRQAERLSSLGRMISGVAHELNNPLAVVKGYLELVLSREQLSPRLRGELQTVAREGERAGKLVAKFLSLSRETPDKRDLADLNLLAMRAAETCGLEEIAAGVDWALELADELPKTVVNSLEVEQMLGNLMTNALQALAGRPGGRRVLVRTEWKGGTLRMAVEDNGPGVPERLRAKIFEPFFTTKPPGQGTGLGLSIAHRVMAEHGGRIVCGESRLGGAAFALEFPLVELPANPVENVIPASPAKARRAEIVERPARAGRILVLDDEAPLAEMLGEILRVLGHEATVCSSPGRALELLREADFDLIFSDFRMPQMNGAEFHRALTSLRPAMARRIIFVTGDVVNEETRRFLESTGNTFIRKPFDLAHVARAAAEMTRLEPEPALSEAA